MSHSLRSLTRLLPGIVGLPIWAAASAGVIWLLTRAWRADRDTRTRVALLMLASVLVNPHVIVYDVTVIAPALLWLGASASARARAGPYWSAVYLLFITLLLPTAAIIGVQASVLLLVWIYLHATAHVRRSFGILGL